jgi:hypothetical protein
MSKYGMNNVPNRTPLTVWREAHKCQSHSNLVARQRISPSVQLYWLLPCVPVLRPVIWTRPLLIFPNLPSLMSQFCRDVLMCWQRCDSPLCCHSVPLHTGTQPGAESLGSTNHHMLLRQKGPWSSTHTECIHHGFPGRIGPRKTLLFLRISIWEIRARNKIRRTN